MSILRPLEVEVRLAALFFQTFFILFRGKKSTEESTTRPSTCFKKRRFSGNRFTKENETEYASSSAKKLAGSEELEATITPSQTFPIINFLLLFSKLSDILKCKTCNKDVTFGKKNEQGLGFKISVQCKCGETLINSCPQIDNKAYEINRRILFAMRLLGVGLHGLNCFCAMIDLGKSMSISTYYDAVENLLVSAKTVFDVVKRKVGFEEKQKIKTLGMKKINSSYLEMVLGVSAGSRPYLV